VNFRLRNVLLLTLTQATSSTSVTLIAAVGSLAGYALASNKALATLPSTMAVIGTALSTIPASLLMKRVGRRVGFVVGALCAMTGGLISMAAMARGQFWLLVAAALFLGVSMAFAQQYRFAAAETSLPEFRSRAISFVLAGGTQAERNRARVSEGRHQDHREYCGRADRSFYHPADGGKWLPAVVAAGYEE